MTASLFITSAVGSPFRDELALMQDEQPGCRTVRHDLHQVLDQDDGNAACRDLPDQVERQIDLARVEAGIDLVEQQELRARGKALGELEALAAGERQRAEPVCRPKQRDGTVQDIRSAACDRLGGAASAPANNAAAATFSRTVRRGNGWTILKECARCRVVRYDPARSPSILALSKMTLPPMSAP